jgi:hypothetical protein
MEWNRLIFFSENSHPSFHVSSQGLVNKFPPKVIRIMNLANARFAGDENYDLSG